jgi:cytoskeletal protein RodZ
MTLSGNESVAPISRTTKKRSLIPVLTALFLLSYALMTMLIVFQGSTIQSQRNLILTLLDDSRQLWASKEKALADKPVQAHSEPQTPSSQADAPTIQAPSTQPPLVRGPLAQAAPSHRGQRHAGKSARPQVEIPPKPAADLSDQRRMLNTI